MDESRLICRDTNTHKMLRIPTNHKLWRGCVDFASYNNPCFLDRGISVWDVDTFYTEGTIVYRPYRYDTTLYPDDADSIWQARWNHTSSMQTYPDESENTWQYLGSIYPAQTPCNSGWADFSPFGGIGRSPIYWKFTVAGLTQISTGYTDQYPLPDINGEYIGYRREIYDGGTTILSGAVEEDQFYWSINIGVSAPGCNGLHRVAMEYSWYFGPADNKQEWGTSVMFCGCFEDSCILEGGVANLITSDEQPLEDMLEPCYPCWKRYTTMYSSIYGELFSPWPFGAYGGTISWTPSKTGPQ